MSQGNARWGVGATGAPGPTGPPGPAGPPGAGASGAKLFELAPVASPRFIGRFTASSGVMEELTPGQGASLIPPFFASGSRGVVLGPTGGVSGNFLRDDGTWAAAGSAGRPSGVTLGEQAVAPPLTVQGRFTLGTGTREDLAPGQVASLIGGGWGSGLQLLTAPTGGIQGRVLRDDGQWVQPSFVASGIALGQLGALSPLRVVGRFTAGSGTPEQLTPPQVASMLPRFAATGTPGLVPQPTGATPSGMFLRDDGVWASPTGLGNGQFSFMPPSTIKGRSGSSGVPEDLVPSAVATMLPLFNNIDKGLVPGSGGGVGNFLRADGSWAAPSVGGAVSGVTFAQIQDISPAKFVGRFQGSGSAQELSPLTAASMLPRMLGSGFGLVVSPTLPVSGNFLRDDGAWATVGTGITNAQHAPFPPLTFQGRFSLGSGTAESVTVPQAASMLPPFFASGSRGLVLGPTGGAAGNYLRDDGSWQAVSAGPGGGGPTMLAGGSSGMVQYNSGSGFGGATGIGITDGGLGLKALGLNVASLTAPLFSTARPGLVPTATSLGQFLKDDGTWATPAGGAATGISNAMRLPMPPLTISGRFTLGSGIPEDLSTAQVASMLPGFTASGGSAGLVTPPTGGASGYFLRDDGTFINLIPRVERQIGNVGSSIGSGFVVGSATIDFTTDPFQSINLFGRTKFYLTPPDLNRHVQLRMYVGGSGISPTFFPSMVKWMGGSGATPAWATNSGAVNFANFFYDGSVMWGSPGIGAG